MNASAMSTTSLCGHLSMFSSSQRVGTSTGRLRRQSHDKHCHYVGESRTIYFEASGNIEFDDIIVDIGGRSWEGNPVFVIVKRVSAGRFMQTGVTRQSVLVTGGSIYNHKQETLVFV